jgi:two-component system, NarL family, sensor kinase
MSPTQAIEALALASLVLRYRRGGDAERRQLLWLLLACLVVFGYAGLWWALFAPDRSSGCS